jgi:hypothetical protein
MLSDRATSRQPMSISERPLVTHGSERAASDVPVLLPVIWPRKCLSAASAGSGSERWLPNRARCDAQTDGAALCQQQRFYAGSHVGVSRITASRKSSAMGALAVTRFSPSQICRSAPRAGDGHAHRSNRRGQGPRDLTGGSRVSLPQKGLN